MGGHAGHDPLLGADEPEPDEPEDPDDPDPDDPDEDDPDEEDEVEVEEDEDEEDADVVVAGAGLVTAPPGAGATAVPAAGTYRSVTRVT